MPKNENAPTPELCEYSAAHTMRGVPATTTINSAVGSVPACQACADFYARQTAH